MSLIPPVFNHHPPLFLPQHVRSSCAVTRSPLVCLRPRCAKTPPAKWHCALTDAVFQPGKRFPLTFICMSEKLSSAIFPPLRKRRSRCVLTLCCRHLTGSATCTDGGDERCVFGCAVLYQLISSPHLFWQEYWILNHWFNNLSILWGLLKHVVSPDVVQFVN